MTHPGPTIPDPAPGTPRPPQQPPGRMTQSEYALTVNGRTAVRNQWGLERGVAGSQRPAVSAHPRHGGHGRRAPACPAGRGEGCLMPVRPGGPKPKPKVNPPDPRRNRPITHPPEKPLHPSKPPPPKPKEE